MLILYVLVIGLLEHKNLNKPMPNYIKTNNETLTF